MRFVSSAAVGVVIVEVLFVTYFSWFGLASFLPSTSGGINGHGPVVDVEPHGAVFGLKVLSSSFDFGGGGAVYFGRGGVDGRLVEDGQFGRCRDLLLIAVAAAVIGPLGRFGMVAIDPVDGRSSRFAADAAS